MCRRLEQGRKRKAIKRQIGVCAFLIWIFY
ncbi:MAG: hypothetical protein ACXU8A_02490 [Burkholderiaceae bacterium]